ncbi:MAG: recombination protein RecR [Lachnospiraceae bacterium]|nr:recombination protein RecR [Lachnospiraceae bacterium]
MEHYSKTINSLIEELTRLPGLGVKTATRLAFHIINMPKEHVKSLSEAMVTAREKVKYCNECYTITDEEVCPICRSSKRNHKVIMVVEEPKDLVAYEKTGQYDGVYHVLHGVVNPQLGISPADIKVRELLKRLEGDVDEVILATGSTTEGEATAMILSKYIKPSGINVTRIASGVPVGGDLEYVDEVTLMRALEGRVRM